MNHLCDYVLTANENIRFGMAIDRMGNMLCTKSVGLYQLQQETAQKLADTFAVLTTGVLKTLTQHHGCLQHVAIKHQNYTTIGQPIKQGYLIYTTTESIEPEITKHITETIKIYRKEEL